MNETTNLAKFVTGLTYDDLPASAIDRCKLLILDQLACQIGVSTKPWLQPARQYVEAMGGTQQSTVVGSNIRVSAEGAAFANGTFGHGFEIDDAYPPGLSHPGAVIVPAALAVAERDGLNGRRLLAAVILGYEIVCRIGQALSPTQLYRGFHPTSVAGPMGAAAAVGSLIGLDTVQMTNAFAIAASHSSGLTECYKSGGEIKRYHAGIAAAAGVRSAELARFGLTGPHTILEGQLGIRAFCDDFDPEPLVSGLRDSYCIQDIWIKRYCCNGMIHASLDAIANIQGRRAFSPESVRRIVVGSNRHALKEVGSIREPKDIFGMQFSMSFTIAIQLIHGDVGLGQFVEATLHDENIKRISQLVTVETDPGIDLLFPRKIGACVRVEFVDGSEEVETVEDCRGSVGNPLTPAEAFAKVREVAGLEMPQPRVEHLIETVMNLEKTEHLSNLARLLVPA